ncbi:hypothetical protein NM688_g4274 [Phlebia brevispora]|uniref:Uncharacterized protein n=1 Tax=Phlebia brevispora TaxID=194682 RepID=A0ACC1T337_9APHY|nr:hypothetical protein NM688_g4274 [Phlebia brevispora]
MRYLRAGHSLLGGVWTANRSFRKDGTGPVTYDSKFTPLGDSIYSTFVTQEAARLVETSDGHSPQNALIIGLGTGIVASAFIQHNISTTVVEIDPQVYQAARTYFGFVPREPKKVFISDARGWVLSRTHEEQQSGWDNPKERAPEETFDIVIHDCFSGGGVPSHLFTVAFWEELKKIMKPEGVVAVNFAGKLLSNSGRSIVITLQSVFPQCRAFFDLNEQPTEENLQTGFINYVFFCTPSTKELVFRPAAEGDYLGSYLRETVLSTLPAHEIDLGVVTRDLEADQLKRYTLTDNRNPLEDWQNLDALLHWKLMREILPDVYWETY